MYNILFIRLQFWVFFLVRKKKDLKKYIFSKSGWRYIILITLYINYIYFTVRNKDIYYIYFFINKIRPILLNVILNSIKIPTQKSPPPLSVDV